MTDDRTPVSPDASALALLRQGATLHQQGQLPQAEALYRQALALAPRNFDALHLLGVIRHQGGRSAEAIALLGQALAIKPNEAPAHSNLGLALAELGRLEDAVASFDRALSLQGDFADALLNRGNVQARLGRHADALASYDAVLALRPVDVRALYGRGNALAALGRHEPALAAYEQVLRMHPADAGAHVNRGNVLLSLGRSDEALACYDCALALEPGNPVALANRASALLALDRPAEALAASDAALRSDADSTQAHNSRGCALLALKRPEEGLACLDRVLARRPDDAEALNNRAAALLDLARTEDALACVERVLARSPDHVPALNNRGLALFELARFPEALSEFARAIMLDPAYAPARVNDAHCRLLLGDFVDGWRALEHRWRTSQYRVARREFAKPQWRGDQPIAGRTVLLHAEQGLGDTVQFCRYAEMVAERGASVVLEAPPVLHPVLASLAGATRLVQRGVALPAFDLHCPLLSLPLAFDTRLTDVPARVPYLRAPPEAVRLWRDRLRGLPRPYVGLAWAGNPAHGNDRRRSLALERIANLLSAPAQFVSLQRDLRDGDAERLPRLPQLAHFGEALTDFGETAALIESLDLVISVDTAVAHLAGAMGKPVWILLPVVPDWRWLLDREDSPWYPTARLFRQTAAGDWDGVLRRVEGALRQRFPGPR
jgi:tetratricopeptide (TPR) repeat protein